MGNDMYNDEQLAHLRSEARRRENQSPSGVLTRESFLRHLHSLADATVSADALHPSEVVLAEHDAALRSRPLPPEVEAACIERGREEVWADVLDSLRAVYGKDMPYDESPCELIVDLVKPSSLPPSVEAAAEALRLRGCVEKILAFLLPIDVVRLVCRTTPETRQSAATAIGNARLACDYALNGGKPENILAPERLSSARSAKGGE